MTYVREISAVEGGVVIISELPTRNCLPLCQRPLLDDIGVNSELMAEVRREGRGVGEPVPEVSLVRVTGRQGCCQMVSLPQQPEGELTPQTCVGPTWLPV